MTTHSDNESRANEEMTEEIEIVERAGGDEAADVAESLETDTYYTYLVAEYQRFRLISWILGACGFALIFISIGLNQAGIVNLGIYNVMMSVAYFFIILMAICIFTRTRPFKRQMKLYKGEPLSKIRDDSAPDGVRMEDPKFRDMDDIYKILERDIRTEVIPAYPEYRKLRRTWLAVFVIAAVLGVISLALYYFYPDLNLIASVMLLGAFVLVVVAFYIDRTRMKPLRNDWARRYGMTEMQMRDNLRAIRKGVIHEQEE